jgi:hypothetical protein
MVAQACNATRKAELGGFQIEASPSKTSPDLSQAVKVGHGGVCPCHPSYGGGGNRRLDSRCSPGTT